MYTIGSYYTRIYMARAHFLFAFYVYIPINLYYKPFKHQDLKESRLEMAKGE